MGRREKVLVLLIIFVPVVLSVVADSAEAPNVVISEVMTSNTTTIFDEDGESSDWIELWNRSPSAVDLIGWRLSDGSGDGWEFPHMALDPGERVVIFASGKAEQRRLHTNFRLSADGEYLGLHDAKGREVSVYRDVPALGSDASFGLGSDGKAGLLKTPTPGRPNSTVVPPTVAKPQLSRAGGYIDSVESITATTATDGAQLWYTTDGSTPTTGHGTQYSRPINVDRSTTLRMVATRSGMGDSFVASATYLVMDDVLAQTGTPLGWSTAPVNGQRYQFGFDQDYIDEYRPLVAAALRAAPTLSITTDLANLIHRETGVYSNPTQSGPAWEREASVEFIDDDSGFQINAGLRLKGGYSRNPNNPKHSFRLTFGNQYEGVLNYPLFGSDGPVTFASVDLRTEQDHAWSFGSDRNTMLRDHFTRESQSAVGAPSTRSRWVHVFLDGQYWGLYMLRDNVTATHARQLWGGSTSDYDVLKHSNLYGYEVADGDDDEWLTMWRAIRDGRVTDDEYGMLATNTDLRNLADFMLVNICVGNADGSPSSFLLELRANNWQAVRGGGQPFRFFIDDAERTLGATNHSIRIDRTQDFAVLATNPEWKATNFNPGWLHQLLLTRSEYRAIVRDRADFILAPEGPLGTDASLTRWRALRDALDPLVEAEVARWGYAGPNEFGRPEWLAEVEWVETLWFPHRTVIVREQLIADGLLIDS